jgi:uncharacterized phage protein (TIGR01671 family)
MREILFRGKLLSTNEWTEGNLAVSKTGVAIITPDDTPIGKYGQVDPETVGQFTGLLDENGDKIFEGDIVYVYRGIRESFRYRVAVEYLEGGFNPFANPNWDSLPNPSEVKIIGNIHDNPELLER